MSSIHVHYLGRYDVIQFWKAGQYLECTGNKRQSHFLKYNKHNKSVADQSAISMVVHGQHIVTELGLLQKSCLLSFRKRKGRSFMKKNRITRYWLTVKRECRKVISLNQNIENYSTVKAPVSGTLNSAISNFQTWFVRTVMEVLKFCWM